MRRKDVQASKGPEKERRWVVRAFDDAMVTQRPTFLQQGYFDVVGEGSLRVRIADHAEAALTRKLGAGLLRDEEQIAAPLNVAQFLFRDTPYTVEKNRYDVDGWDLDVFVGPLKGIVLLEREVKGDEGFPPLPAWVTDAVEVTDSLTNLHLARLARVLVEGDAPRAIKEHLVPRLPKIVLTGGPCAGKSTLMAEIREQFGAQVHCVPETATILITQVGIRPSATDPLQDARFQSTLFRVQREFEEAAEVQARTDGKKAIVLDRGTIDGLAYMRGGDTEFLRVTGHDPDIERQRYNRVLCLAPPPEDVYARERGNNPARWETYEQAVALGWRTAEVWGMETSEYFLETSWEGKRRGIFDLLERVRS